MEGREPLASPSSSLQRLPVTKPRQREPGNSPLESEASRGEGEMEKRAKKPSVLTRYVPDPVLDS